MHYVRYRSHNIIRLTPSLSEFESAKSDSTTDSTEYRKRNE